MYENLKKVKDYCFEMRNGIFKGGYKED
jgi:hypothetical protein